MMRERKIPQEGGLLAKTSLRLRRMMRGRKIPQAGRQLAEISPRKKEMLTDRKMPKGRLSSELTWMMMKEL